MSKWAVRVRLRDDSQTQPMQVLDGDPGYIVVVVLAGVDVCQGIRRLHEGGAEDREAGIVVVARAERFASDVGRNTCVVEIAMIRRYTNSSSRTGSCSSIGPLSVSRDAIFTR